MLGNPNFEVFSTLHIFATAQIAPFHKITYFCFPSSQCYPHQNGMCYRIDDFLELADLSSVFVRVGAKPLIKLWKIDTTVFLSSLCDSIKAAFRISSSHTEWVVDYDP